VERRMTPPCRHVRRACAAPVRRRPARRGADRRSTADRLLRDVGARRGWPVHGCVRAQLPRRHRPGTALLRGPLPAGAGHGRTRLRHRHRPGGPNARRRTGNGARGRWRSIAGASAGLPRAASVRHSQAPHRRTRTRRRGAAAATRRPHRRAPNQPGHDPRPDANRRPRPRAADTPQTANPARAHQRVPPPQLRARPTPPVADTARRSKSEGHGRRPTFEQLRNASSPRPRAGRGEASGTRTLRGPVRVSEAAATTSRGSPAKRLKCIAPPFYARAYPCREAERRIGRPLGAASCGGAARHLRPTPGRRTAPGVRARLDVLSIGTTGPRWDSAATCWAPPPTRGRRPTDLCRRLGRSPPDRRSRSSCDRGCTRSPAIAAYRC